VKHSLCAFVALIAVAAAQPAVAQQPQKPESAPQKPTATTLMASIVRVQLVLSKYKGEKKISSLPYTLSAAIDRRSQLRVGADVPYSTTRLPVKTSAEGKPAEGPVSHSYRTIGTQIDCLASVAGEGRFRLDITIEDSSISYGDDTKSRPDAVPAFRHFVASNSLVLKDGETGQVTTAADPITGEVLRVDVTITVLK
jgi:hypothetical protein